MSNPNHQEYAVAFDRCNLTWRSVHETLVSATFFVDVYTRIGRTLSARLPRTEMPEFAIVATGLGYAEATACAQRMNEDMRGVNVVFPEPRTIGSYRGVTD